MYLTPIIHPIFIQWGYSIHIIPEASNSWAGTKSLRKDACDVALFWSGRCRKNGQSEARNIGNSRENIGV